MPSWLRAPRVPQEGGGDPFLESEACDSPEGRAFLDGQDAVCLELLVALKAERGKVLILGSGTGRLALKIAQTCPDCEVTGVDCCGPALEESLEKARGLGLVGRVWFLEGDACRLDLPEHSFDSVLCDGLLHHLADPSRLLDGMRRVVRPGGTVLLRDIERPLRPFWARLLGRPRPAAPEPLRQAWQRSAAAAYSLDELSDFAARSPLAGAAVRRQADGHLVLTRRF